MAVSLDSEPASRSTFYYLSEPLEYKFSLDDLGTAPEVKKLVYQVFAEDSGANEIPLTEKKYIKPLSTSQVIYFVINDNVKSSFDVDVPLLDGNSSPQSWNGSIRKVFVKYGELIVNTETGVTTGDATIETTKHNVVNGYEQAYTNQTKSAVTLLSDCDNTKINDNSHDWVMLFSSGATNENITITQEDGTETVMAVALVEGFTLVPVGGANIEAGAIDSKTIKEVKVKNKSIYYNHSYSNARNRIDVYFQEPKGSWKVMNFNVTGVEEVSRDFLTICRNNGVAATVADLVKSHGHGIINQRSWLRFEANKDAFVRTGNVEYYRMFANARQYRAPIHGSDHSTILFPVIPNSNSTPVWAQHGKTSIEFEGSIGIDLRTGSI